MHVHSDRSRCFCTEIYSTGRQTIGKAPPYWHKELVCCTWKMKGRYAIRNVIRGGIARVPSSLSILARRYELLQKEREHTFPLLRFTSSALKAACVANGSGEDACSASRTTTVTKAFMSFYESAVHHPRLRFVVGKDTRAVLEGPNRPGDILDAKGFP